MATSGLVDCMAHLDLVKIFGFRPTTGSRRSARSRPLRNSNANLAMELSTAGWRKPVGELYPSDEIIRRGHDEGNPIHDRVRRTFTCAAGGKLRPFSAKNDGAWDPRSQRFRPASTHGGCALIDAALSRPRFAARSTSSWPRYRGILPRFQAARRQPNNRAGRKSTALTSARRASKVIPSKRNGSATSQTIGKSTNASRASGHERTRRIHHPTKRISVFTKKPFILPLNVNSTSHPAGSIACLSFRLRGKRR